MHRTAFFVALLAAAASAQVLPVTSPKGLDMIEGNMSFNFGSNRRMMGIDNTQLASVLVINGFALRRDGTGVSSNVAGTMNLEINLGVADFGRMSAEFDKNYVNNSKTLAHSLKPVNYPAWNMSAGAPAPFDLIVTLDQAFIYTGQLAIVWDISYSSLTSSGHQIDRNFGSLSSRAGIAFGTGCASTGTGLFAHKITTWDMGAPLGPYGLSLQISTANAPANANVLMHLGVAPQNIPLPGLCAPVLALPDLAIPLGAASSAGLINDIYLQVPYDPAIELGSFVTQLAALDPGQVGIPVSLSNGVQFGFAGSGAGTNASAYLWAPLPATVGTGNFVFIGGSPVVQFR